MVSSACRVITCILLLAGTLFAQAQSAPERISGTNIAGKVTIKGKGASGIAVALLAIDESRQELTRYKAFTDDTGNYRITNVPPGKYRVVAAAPAYVPAKQFDSFKSLLLGKGETVENIDFDLFRGGVITGKVTDADGRPVIEETVSLAMAEMKEGFLHSIPWQVRTDDRGIYRIFGIPSGKYRVLAGTEDDLRSGGWESVGYRRTFHPATSDASQATIIEVTESSEKTGVDITLGRPRASYSARGRIIDGETGQPLANMPYGVRMFVSPTSTATHSGGVVSNRDGEFRLENLSPGKYAVVVEASPDSNWRVEPVRFEVIDRDVTDLIVKALKGASVSGVVVLEGPQDNTVLAKLKIEQLWVHLMNEGSATSSSHSDVVKRDGSFRIAGLQAGRLAFGFMGRGFEVVRVERDGIVQPANIEIKEREQISGLRIFAAYGSGSIRGVVKLPTGTRPPNSHLSISLRRLGEAAGPFNSGSHIGVEVDARGQFSAEGLFPGTYELNAGLYIPNELISKLPKTKQQVVVTNGAVTNITLTLQASDPE